MRVRGEEETTPRVILGMSAGQNTSSALLHKLGNIKVTITVLWFCLEGVWSYFGSPRRQDGVNLSMVHHYSAPLQCIAIVQGCITVVYCWKDCIMQRNRAKLQDDDGTVRTGKSTHSLPTSHQNKCSLDGSLQMRTSDGELESSLKCGETHADSVETAQQDWSN